MKAVIVELRNGYASVLSDDGCIVKIKDNNYEIGQVIQMTNQRNNMVKKIVTFAAGAAAIMVLSVSTWAYASPYTYVSLDVNPSIEFVLNRFDRVLTIKSVNDDGEDVLQEITLKNLKNKTIVQAINQTIDQISQLGYLSDGTTAGIVITTSGKNMDKADELAIEIKDEVEDEISKTYDSASVEVFSIGMERVEAARELGVTPGKLNLVEKLIASSNDAENINLQEWLDKPVKDIMKATKAYRKAATVSGSAITIESIDDDLPTDKENVKEARKTAKEAAKEADKAAKEANKAAKEADKVATKAAKEADKIAKDAAKAIERATREAEKTAKNGKTEEDKETEKSIKDEAKEAERAAKESAKDAKNAAKEAEKAAKDAKKAAKDAKKAEKENDHKSTIDAEAEAKKAAKEAEKAAKDAHKALKNTKDNDIGSASDNTPKQKSNAEDKGKSNGQANNNSSQNSGKGKGPKK